MDPNNRSQKSGFSIIELAVVVTVIGIVALLGTPGIRTANERTTAMTYANDLRVLVESFEFYSTVEGGYPQDMDFDTMPGDMDKYVSLLWKDGSYTWFYVNSPQMIMIYNYGLNFTPEQALLVDSVLDDGNITTGYVRVGVNNEAIIYLFYYDPDSFNV